MKLLFTRILLVFALITSVSSCVVHKHPERVIVVHKKDNGKHKGWYKNPNNPHHPRTTNPGHTKHKYKGGKGKGHGNGHGNGHGKGKGKKH